MQGADPAPSLQHPRAPKRQHARPGDHLDRSKGQRSSRLPSHVLAPALIVPQLCRSGQPRTSTPRTASSSMPGASRVSSRATWLPRPSSSSRCRASTTWSRHVSPGRPSSTPRRRTLSAPRPTSPPPTSGSLASVSFSLADALTQNREQHVPKLLLALRRLEPQPDQPGRRALVADGRHSRARNAVRLLPLMSDSGAHADFQLAQHAVEPCAPSRYACSGARLIPSLAHSQVAR